MEIRLSAKGHLVLPSAVRRKLDLRRGDTLDIKTEAGRIALTPRRKRSKKASISIVVDALTGLPVLTAGPDAPPLSSEQVREILSSIP
jgi:AbrB family looped-hinge helix DNA binding protein